MADGQPASSHSVSDAARAQALEAIERQRSQALSQTEAQRLRLLNEIGERRDSVVVTYITSTRPGAAGSIQGADVRIIENHIRAAKSVGRRNVDLFLATHGGNGAAPWDIVAMLREYFRNAKFGVILPSVAYSAGACICLGADEIVMGPASVLGPVDAQLNGGASTSDFQGFLDIVRDFGGGTNKKRTLEWLVSQPDGWLITRLYRLWKEDWRIVVNLLKSRRHRVSDDQVKAIAEYMLYEVAEHGQGIRRTEARSSGKLSSIVDVERTGLEAEVAELFNCYAELMRIYSPFARPLNQWRVVVSEDVRTAGPVGNELDYDAEGIHVSATPVAIVESEHATNAAYVAYGLRHWDKVAPVVPKAPAVLPIQPTIARASADCDEFWIASRDREVRTHGVSSARRRS